MLARSSPLRRMAMKRQHRNTGPDTITVDLLLDRSEWRCEICNCSCVGPRGLAWHVHHRRPRAMGGSSWIGINKPSNLMVLCPSCHQGLESYRATAQEYGHLVPSVCDPLTTAIVIRGRWCYLTDTFEYADNPPSGAA